MMVRGMVLLAALAAAGSGICGAQGGGGGTQTRTIGDAQWGMPAGQVTMPAGWEFDGVATHGEGCVSDVPDVLWAASSPDGTLRIQHYPQITYTYSSNQGENAKSEQGGCLVTQFWKPEDFLTHVVGPHLHPGAQMQAQSAPAGAEMQDRMQVAAQGDRNASSHGLTQHTEVSFGQVLMVFQRGNAEVGEVFRGIFTCTQTQFHGSSAKSVRCTMDTGVGITGSKEQVESVLRQGVTRVAMNEAWEQRGMEVLHERFAAQNAQMQKMFANDRQGQLALGQTLMANQQAQFDAGVKRNRMTNDALHTSMQGSINHMGDVNDYTDPATGKQYKVSNQYSHTYLDSTGKTILQTNSAYAPGPDTVWQELQPR